MTPLTSQPPRLASLFTRSPRNPILSAADWPYQINSVFNPGAVLLRDGSTLLLCRVEDLRGHSHLTAARSANGVDGWQIDPEPALFPDPDGSPDEIWGVEDPRITYLPELDKFAVAYTSFSESGPGVSLALTDDFRSFERYGVIMRPDDKDAALFPSRIGNDWVAIHRPVHHLAGRLTADIWLSRSADLRHWGDSVLVLAARRGAWWDANKVGLSLPPIETPRGWLLVYHGVRSTASGALYRVGLALFDRDDPTRGVLRSDSWVFGPQESYERQGDVDNVVFPCGYTLADDGDTLNMYYGAADTCIGLATTSIQRLLEWLDWFGQPGTFYDSAAS